MNRVAFAMRWKNDSIVDGYTVLFYFIANLLIRPGG